MVELPMILNEFLIYIIVGLVCGFVDSSLGMGYGVSATTVLISFGITPAIASASIHTSEGFVDIISGLSHWKFGNIQWNLFWKLILPGVLGAVLGAIFLSYLSLNFAKPFVSFILFFLGIIILIRFLFKQSTFTKQIPHKLIPIIGFIAAFIDISGGGGWGPILTPIFILNDLEPRRAIGTVEVTEPFISFAGVLTFGLLLGFESFLWALVIPLLIGGFILTPIAAYLSKKVPKHLLGISVGLWLVILNLRTILMWIWQ